MSTTCQCPKISLPLLTRRRNKLFLVISPIYKTPGWLFTRPTSLLIVDSLLMPQELPPSPHTLSGGSALGPETDACDEVSSVFVRQLRTPEPDRSRAVRKLRPADAPDELAGHAYRSVLSACHWRGGLRSVGLAQSYGRSHLLLLPLRASRQTGIGAVRTVRSKDTRPELDRHTNHHFPGYGAVISHRSFFPCALISSHRRGCGPSVSNSELLAGRAARAPARGCGRMRMRARGPWAMSNGRNSQRLCHHLPRLYTRIVATHHPAQVSTSISREMERHTLQLSSRSPGRGVV